MIEQGTEYWDGNRGLDFEFDDGGRAAAGFKGSAGDCVTRAVAIASGKPYAEVYKALAAGNATQRITKHVARSRRGVATARNGINTGRKWFKDYMDSLGFVWIPTMQIGSGCKVHLLNGEVPMDRIIIARVTKHYVAIVNGVIRDTSDPQLQTIHHEPGKPPRMSHRCVYGYWSKA